MKGEVVVVKVSPGDHVEAGQVRHEKTPYSDCAIQHLCDLDSGCRGNLRHENGDGGPVPGERRGQSDSCGCRGQDRPRGPPGRGRGREAVRGRNSLSSEKRWRRLFVNYI